MTIPTTASRQALHDALEQSRVMAILRYRKPGDVIAAIDALSTGGVRVLEVTVDTPGYWEAIADAAQRPDIFVGAGTVTDVQQVTSAVAAGCQFIVSPGFDADVVHAATTHGLDVFPGVATGTEVMAARRRGCRYFKLFPAGALGPRYLSELRGPFSAEAFVATGGITIADIPTWLAAGAFAVAIGSDLAGREPPATADQLTQLTNRAAEAIAHAHPQTNTNGAE